MCSPMIDSHVIPIQERIKRCHKGFNDFNVICIRCIAYSTCKKQYYEYLASRVKPIKLKGKCPKGRKIKFVGRR